MRTGGKNVIQILDRPYFKNIGFTAAQPGRRAAFLLVRVEMVRQRRMVHRD